MHEEGENIEFIKEKVKTLALVDPHKRRRDRPIYRYFFAQGKKKTFKSNTFGESF